MKKYEKQYIVAEKKHINLRRGCFFTLVVILLLIMVGCSKDEIVDKLTIGVMSDVGAVPFYMAQQEGFFKELNLDVEIKVFKSAIDRDTALQTGNLDGAMTDMLSIIFFKDAAFDVKMTSSTYGNYKMVTSPTLDETTFLELKEQTIGLSSNTVIDFATEQIAEEQGLMDTMSKVAIPQMPVRLELLRVGELSAATLPDPLASAAVLDGGIIVGSTEDLGLYPAIFIMSEDILGTNPEGVRRLYEGYNRAVDYLNESDSDVYFDQLVEGLGFPTILTESFVMTKFEHITAPDQTTFETTLNWMNKQGLTQSSYTYEELTDAQYLPR